MGHEFELERDNSKPPWNYAVPAAAAAVVGVGVAFVAFVVACTCFDAFAFVVVADFAVAFSCTVVAPVVAPVVASVVASVVAPVVGPVVGTCSSCTGFVAVWEGYVFE